MPLHLRQICFAARDFERTCEQFVRVLGVEPCFSDPDVAMFGLQNSLFQIGADFLEIVSPISSDAPLNRFLQVVGDEAGYMLIAQVGSRAGQDGIRRRAEEAGIRAAWEITHRGADFLQWNPADTGGVFLETSFDHEADPTGRWAAAGGDIGPDNGWRLQGVTVSIPDPSGTARRWAALTGCALGPPGFKLHFGGKFVEFRKPGADMNRAGIAGIMLGCPDPEAVVARAHAAGLPICSGGFTLCGVRMDVAA